MPVREDARDGPETNIERERKLAAPDSFELPAFADRRVLSDDELVLSAVYWDTPDLRLLRRGHTLRWRSASNGEEDGWTLKLAPAPDGEDDGDDLLSRAELTMSGLAETPPADALRIVAGLTRRQSLGRVARLTTARRRIEFAGEDGEAAVELVDDDVVTDVAGRPAQRFRQLELELLGSTAPDEIEALQAELIEAGAAVGAAAPKLAAALGPLPATSAPPTLRPRSPAADLVRHALADGLERLLAHDPHVRRDAGEEAVHQARVATRRLRSDLRTLAPLLQADEVARLRSELAWLGSWLGGVRDNDVLGLWLAEELATLDSSAAGAELFERLGEDRRARRAELVGVLASSRCLDLYDTLERALESPPFEPDAELDEPAGDAARRAARRAWRRTERAVSRLGDPPAEVELHEIRKRAKQARYAVELSASVLGKPARRLAKRLAAVQSTLGELQDTVVAIEWLTSAVQRPGLSSSAAFLAGELAERRRGEAARARARWERDWERAAEAASGRWLNG